MMKRIVLLTAVLAAACWSDGRLLAAAKQDTPAAPRGLNDGVIFHFDFNAVKDGKVIDKSPSRYEGTLVGAEVCEGVDGYAVRLPGSHACVTVDLAEGDRKLDQFSLDLWVSPEEAAHQEVITAGSARSDFDDLPIMLRWRQGCQMGFSVQAADNERRCMIPTKPCLDTISFPRDRSWMHVVATYDGETTMPGEIRSLAGSEQWAKIRKATVETMFQLESDDLPCRLDRRRAREVTPNVPFDFSRLYDHDPSKLALTPLKRDAPIFMDDEPVAFRLDVPKGVQEKCMTYPWMLSDVREERSEGGVQRDGQ